MDSSTMLPKSEALPGLRQLQNTITAKLLPFRHSQQHQSQNASLAAMASERAAEKDAAMASLSARA